MLEIDQYTKKALDKLTEMLEKEDSAPALILESAREILKFSSVFR